LLNVGSAKGGGAAILAKSDLMRYRNTVKPMIPNFQSIGDLQSNNPRLLHPHERKIFDVFDLTSPEKNTCAVVGLAHRYGKTTKILDHI
jgi:hypothetical protein